MTRGFTDDCNSIPIAGDTVYLQIAKSGLSYVFYSPEDGKKWHILRVFELESRTLPRVGFESQSPSGRGKPRYLPKSVTATGRFPTCKRNRSREGRLLPAVRRQLNTVHRCTCYQNYGSAMKDALPGIVHRPTLRLRPNNCIVREPQVIAGVAASFGEVHPALYNRARSKSRANDGTLAALNGVVMG